MPPPLPPRPGLPLILDAHPPPPVWLPKNREFTIVSVPPCVAHRPPPGAPGPPDVSPLLPDPDLFSRRIQPTIAVVHARRSRPPPDPGPPLRSALSVALRENSQPASFICESTAASAPPGPPVGGATEPNEPLDSPARFAERAQSINATSAPSA